MAERIPLTAEEKKFSYSKYYDMEMAPIPQEKLDILRDGPIDPSKALRIEDRAELFKPGCFECESGFCVMPDGTGYVANRMVMPGVAPEMYEWWVAWHSLEDVRYKIWDPEDHFYARARDRERVLDKSLPMRERVWGVAHDVFEDIGMGPGKLVIDFKYPEYLGYDASKVGTKCCATLIGGNVYSPPGEEGVPLLCVMTHFVRALDDGMELRSRFWIGYQVYDGVVKKMLPEGVSVPVEATRALFNHNVKEFSNLGKILPQVYAEEKDNW